MSHGVFKQRTDADFELNALVGGLYERCREEHGTQLVSVLLKERLCVQGCVGVEGMGWDGDEWN